MELRAAKILANYGGKVHSDYSGRGMYGMSTAAVVTDDIMGLIANVIRNEDQEERDLVADAIDHMREDNMGLSMIYY